MWDLSTAIDLVTKNEEGLETNSIFLSFTNEHDLNIPEL